MGQLIVDAVSHLLTDAINRGSMLKDSFPGCVYARQRDCGVSRVIELLATTARESTSVMSEEQELDHYLGMSSNGSPEVADGLLPYRLDSIGLQIY
jgi:hypothetical protein